MGTGKSVVGQLAAKKLNLSFLDSDQEIEKSTENLLIKSLHHW